MWNKFVNENTQPGVELFEVCFSVWERRIESLYKRINDDDDDYDDGGDNDDDNEYDDERRQRLQRHQPKGIKIQTKNAHTRYEI